MKTLLLITIPTISIFAAGAWNYLPAPKTSTAPVKTTVPVIASAAVQPAKVPQMWAKKTTLYKGETLELEFAAPNAPFLGVVDPSGHFFYIVFPADAAVGALRPLVDSEHFAGLKQLRINTRSLKADPYIYGVYQNQRVFTQSGTYTFILGENLHIDDPEFVDKVSVQYFHTARPNADVAMN
ncbi:MAG: hypothetical protein JNK89_07045 [Saprospiraceae bacterium]|nr:hypothetical protein [Saprospiraceae bacterium]